jgi:hypothetical protein
VGAEDAVDRPDWKPTADQQVLESGNVPPDPATTKQPAAELVSSEWTEGRKPAGARDAVDTKPLASLEPADGVTCLGAEDSVNRSDGRSPNPQRDLKGCDVWRPCARRRRGGQCRRRRSDEEEATPNSEAANRAES